MTEVESEFGRCNAIALAQRDALVNVNETTSDIVSAQLRSDSVVDEIYDTGGKAIINLEPIREFSGAQRMADNVLARYGRIDILVNSATSSDDQTFCNSDGEHFRGVL